MQQIRFYSVMVITLVSDTSNPGSIPGRTFLFLLQIFSNAFVHIHSTNIVLMAGLILVSFKDCISASIYV
jgi:hypothetical protein